MELKWIVIGVGVVLLFWFVSMYNKLITYRNHFKNAFAQIDVQLKRRYDLIPNLVESTKKYLSHERETLEAVIQARNQAVQTSQKVSDNPADASAMKNLMAAEGALTGALGKLFALSESYPDLKGDQTISQLMEELTSTENKISYARQAFNDAVTSYNNSREQFPNNIVSGMFAFKEAELYEVKNIAEREAVKVQF